MPPHQNLTAGDSLAGLLLFLVIGSLRVRQPHISEPVVTYLPQANFFFEHLLPAAFTKAIPQVRILKRVPEKPLPALFCLES
ncbi:hypothetical protein [Microcoleus sp. FACHB-68]|uniref:hypothetical protein n=1 Tax=Microcoleus sp. FACHB-68 TaxID=2692826 RepID=UPI001686601F|nr:hypothetical protein [Microcoleus sp. FACHB-68]MBD1936047.1 hypothetical protein [Microcoleus sp. FACHB-68]